MLWLIVYLLLGVAALLAVFRHQSPTWVGWFLMPVLWVFWPITVLVLDRPYEAYEDQDEL